MMITNDGLPMLINSSIIEYDIRHGNVSIMRHFKLFPEDEIAKLDAMPKKQRNISVGLLQRNKEFAHNLENGFDQVVHEFIDLNGLDPDVDILSIRRDAVFVVNKPILHQDIGNDIHFAKKNQYHAALQIGPRYEFYFGDNNQVDIKNFIQVEKDTDGILDKLKPGMISFLSEFVDIAEGSNMNRNTIYKWIRDFCTYYKEKDLDIEYYREFNRDALFKVITEDGATYMDFVPDYMVDDIDGSFNYTNIIIPLLRILI